MILQQALTVYTNILLTYLLAYLLPHSLNKESAPGAV